MNHNMDSSANNPKLPENYVQLPGSERRPAKGAKLLGPADAAETFKVTIVLRRRTDGTPIQDFDYYGKTPPGQREKLSSDDFAGKYGADPAEMDKVVKFVQSQGLKVEETHAARRSVIVSGTTAAYNKAFGLNLGRYEHTVTRDEKRKKETVNETYRGRDGYIHVPKDLTDIIVGVFGLDNRNITQKNTGDPPNTHTISVATVTQLYHFPANSAAGQTIAIFSEAGFKQSDITATIGGGVSVTSIAVDASNDGSADPETTQDICIASAAAPGAAIAVYFTTGTQAGWVDLINRVIHPTGADPHCSVLSSSFYILNSDDAATLSTVSKNFINALTMAFEDAAAQGVTICIACGDTGSDSKIGDHKAHVQYPGSDPWVLSIGGTTVGNVSGNTCDEYVWNDTFTIACFGQTFSGSGATGGGVSGYFPKPSYQNGTAIPVSLNGGHVGRGLPDVAANASPSSGYPITVNGLPCVGNGTSASAPLWAGLIAVVNAALGQNVGFINPYIYQFGSSAFKDIVGAPGPANNAMNGAPGYPANVGWDACTGWGSPNGTALLSAFQGLALPHVYISGGYQSPDIILTDLTTHTPVPIGGIPGGVWDTLLKPSTSYGFSAVVHNNSGVAANNVQVTFWAIPGGVGTNGTMVGTPQTVATVPAHGSVTVNASAPFVSAPLGGHMCAVVSLFSGSTGCTVNATSALQIPDPGQGGAFSCSAWRNTDSTLVMMNSAFKFNLGLGEIKAHAIEPVELLFQTLHVPHNYETVPKIKAIIAAQKLRATAAAPLYLHPAIIKLFEPVRLQTKLVPPKGTKITGEASKWVITPEKPESNISFEITGALPATAKNGDIYLVNITANYPRTAPSRVKSVQFLEIIHVVSKLPWK